MNNREPDGVQPEECVNQGFVFSPVVVTCKGCDSPYHFDNEKEAISFAIDHNRYVGHLCHWGDSIDE